MDVHISIEICREGVKTPTYSRKGDAGMDVCAAIDVLLEPGATVIVPTGLRFAIPEGYEIQVRPRSGISLHTPLRIPNSPGTIDAGYRDELGILMTNSSPIAPAEEDEEVQPLGLDARGGRFGPYQIRKGDRIAQIVLAETTRMIFEVVADVRSIGEDRGGGFGSTGR
jgi:dUTP pyrophosphatase